MTVPEKYAALMNAELDGANSAAESAELRHYLAQNSEAAQYYQELELALDIFDEVRPVRAPSNLAQTVMKEIDAAEQPHRRESPFAAFIRLVRGPAHLRSEFAFAAGLLAGVCLLAVGQHFLSGDGLPRNEQIFGTARPSPAEIAAGYSRPFTVDSSGVRAIGTISVTAEAVFLQAEIDSPTPLTLQLHFEDRLFLEGYLASGPGQCTVTAQDGSMIATVTGRNSLQFWLRCPDRLRSAVGLQIRRGESLLLEQDLTPTDH